MLESLENIKETYSLSTSEHFYYYYYFISTYDPASNSEEKNKSILPLGWDGFSQSGLGKT